LTLISLLLALVAVPNGMESGILVGHRGRSVAWYQQRSLAILLGGNAAILVLLWISTRSKGGEGAG
jgi:hypothetical protein